MSVSTVYRIRCDAPRCRREEEHDTEEMLLAVVHSYGWVCKVGGEDYCMDHKEQATATEEARPEEKARFCDLCSGEDFHEGDCPRWRPTPY